MENGNIVDHLQWYPEADRIAIVRQISHSGTCAHAKQTGFGYRFGTRISTQRSSSRYPRRLKRGTSPRPPRKLILSRVIQQNILVTPSCRACIADFGLSVAADPEFKCFPSSSSRGSTGTLRWKAPELLWEQPNTRESDIYALGCVFYEVGARRPLVGAREVIVRLDILR
jgi:serine/threonine protein kinase